MPFSRVLKQGLAVLALAAGLMASGPTVPASAGELEDLKREIQELKDGQARIRAEIGEVMDLLQSVTRGRGAPRESQPTEVSIAGSSFLGEADAPVVLIEFSDYQCPFCLRHFQTVMPQLRAGSVAEGTLKYVMKEFPIDSIHPLARKASQAALCAGDEGAYWAMHDKILEDPRRLRPRDLQSHAAELDLDEDDFAECLESNVKNDQVNADLALGQSLGVRGTPSFLVGIANPQDPTKVTAVELIRGAQPLAVFQQAIARAQAAAGRS